jgi:dCMP deaminase
MTRPSWDEYFLSIVNEVSRRSTCDRGKAGAVAVKDKRILATGYAGAPSGMKHCDEIGHMMKSTTHEDGSMHDHCVRTTHAEQNIICQAAKFGTSLEGATLYMKMTPCFNCAKMIVNSGIKRVVCQRRYHEDKDTIDLFRDAGIKFDAIENDIEKYDRQKLK